ncbi:MAG: hypothetical protein KAG61_09940 [Bacteriovoracaceae bacterium]|nr:hypothetical protein [Bacteriovoracaceae bacterium]
MIYCPVVNMPDYFTRLLRGNMQSSGNLYRSLPIYFDQIPSLKSLVSHSFSSIDPRLRVDFLLNSLGWHGFRNRLTGLFLHYEEHGKFPPHTDPDAVDDILLIEDRLKGHTPGNFSRTFLLGLYLKMSQLHIQKVGLPQGRELLQIDNSIFDLLDKYTGSKLVKLDLFILGIIHMQHFFGKETIREYIRDGASYPYLFEKLNEQQKEMIMSNLLAYGASIGEIDFFHNKMV